MLEQGHFRNPHPKNISLFKKLGSATLPGVADFFNTLDTDRYKGLEQKINEGGEKRAYLGENGDVVYTGNKISAQYYIDYRTFWKKVDLQTAMQKEMIILDEVSYDKINFAPSALEYQELTNQLNGCIEYHQLEQSERRKLYNMKSPKSTIILYNFLLSDCSS